MTKTKITIKKTFEFSGDLKNASDEAKREIINELFTEKQIETIWNGVRSWASYLEYHTKTEKNEIEKYKKLAWVFYP
jgi:hypothetical protein